MKLVNRGDVNAIASAPILTKRWLKDVTVISESWMSAIGPSSLCNQDSMLESPSPKYDPKEDMVVGFASAKYGPKGWELPIRQITVTGAERFVWFARALLEGGVGLENGDLKKGVMAKLSVRVLSRFSFLIS